MLCRHQVPFILSIVGDKIYYIPGFAREFLLTETHYLTYSSTVDVESQ